MDRANSETLAFLLPGLLHQFGNLLLSIQGNVLTVTLEDLGAAKQAVLAATARGGNSLDILRCLLGDPGPGAGDPVLLVAQLAELVRLPMREAQQLLELRLPDAPLAGVDRVDFVVLLAETLRHLVAVVPQGVRGRIVLELAAAPPGLTVRVLFESLVGDLPFPLPMAELRETLRSRAQQTRAGATCRLVGQSLEWHFQSGAVSREHEA